MIRGGLIGEDANIRFGKFQGVLKLREKVVDISVNGVPADFQMHLDHKAYFLREVVAQEEDNLVFPPSSDNDKDEYSRRSKSCDYDAEGSAKVFDFGILGLCSSLQIGGLKLGFLRLQIVLAIWGFGVREAYLLFSNALAFIRRREMKAISQATVSAFTILHRQDRHREQPCHLYSRAKRATTQSLFFAPQAASSKPPPRVLPSSRKAISNEQLHLCHDT
ncbi:hypothetical protein V8G54_036295 [Vigna mungo]|uniref:Lipin N-terminal domain-containing protein n=1 Tax=Vigna mungo TaxID=3915 RepID=A0AAQ3MGH1_VIGMU